jgi:hypothetical protein
LQASKSKANPRHYAPGNHAPPLLCRLPALCDVVRRGQQPPRGTVPPTPVRPVHHTLEKGRRNPQRDGVRLLCAHTGWRCDVRPVGAVTSVAISPMRPSPPLQHHLGHCITIPNAVEHAATGHRHASHCASYGLMSMAPSNPHADGPRTSDLNATPSRLLLETHRTHRDAPPEARFARTTVYSMALYAIPPHVARTEWHACKLLPPWPIKGGVVP